jgi:FAD/FMN-containing dehydrogenase
MPCWPSAHDWQTLARRLTGKLSQPTSPLAPCRTDYDGSACQRARVALRNPLALQDDPGATQSLGWLDAWDSAPSLYAVEASSPEDVQAAVDFAREHRLRLVVKGTGHDYLGRSSAPDSLLVWTHTMRKISVHDSLVPEGCDSKLVGVPAITVGAGTRWLEAFRAATEHGRFVQGGGCLTVGAAGGFLQGGGFGPWSNRFGIVAANLLQAHVVTADGRLRVANACQNADLFWALRGGGGGTFGVVTDVTLQTFPAPEALGFILGDLTAPDEPTFQALLEKFVRFYRASLMSPKWGEHITVRDKRIALTLSFFDIDSKQAAATWAPFLAELDAMHVQSTAHFVDVPAHHAFDDTFETELSQAITVDPRPEQHRPLFWWRTNQGEVAAYWYAYTSRWIPEELFDPEHAARLAQTLFDASRIWDVELYFSKGQASASADARRRDTETSVNPVVLRSAALAIIAASGSGAKGVPGHEPDAVQGHRQKAAVERAMEVIRKATPDSGSYVNETDYFEPDWQRAFWGDNYPRLLEVKHKYDPRGLFQCHHCVGSEPR